MLTIFISSPAALAPMRSPAIRQKARSVVVAGGLGLCRCQFMMASNCQGGGGPLVLLNTKAAIEFPVVK